MQRLFIGAHSHFYYCAIPLFGNYGPIAAFWSAQTNTFNMPPEIALENLLPKNPHSSLRTSTTTYLHGLSFASH